MDPEASKRALVAEKAHQMRATASGFNRPRVILGWSCVYTEHDVGMPAIGFEEGAAVTKRIVSVRKLVCTFTKSRCDEDAWHTLGVIANAFGMPEQDMDALEGNVDAPRETRRFMSIEALDGAPVSERERFAVMDAMGYSVAPPASPNKPAFGPWKSTSRKGKR